MNDSPTPTSPKKISDFERERLKSTKFFNLFILSLIVGLCAGFFGFLIGYKFIYPENPEIIKETVIKETSASEEARSISEAINKINPSIVHILNKESGELLGNGVVLTSDGWIITSIKIDEEVKIKNFEGKIYQVKNNYYNLYSQTTFIKISAENLRPVEFVNSEQIRLGENTLVYENYPGFGEQLYKDDLVNIRAFVEDENSFSSYPYRFILNNEYPLQFNGGPVMNYYGEVIGLLTGGNVILPNRAFTPFIDKVLSQEKFEELDLGVSYKNISKMTDGEKINYKLSDQERGVYITSSTHPKMKSGDIVMYLNNIPLDEEREFNDIILDFQPSDELEALIIRNEEQQTIKFIL